MSKVNTLIIQTPEGIVFSQLLAGPMTRFLAWAIDMLCITLVCSTIATLFRVLAIISADLSHAIVLLAGFVVTIGYGIATEWYLRGQSIGKKVLRLRVMDAGGLRLQFSQIVIRNLLRFVDVIPVLYLVGGLACVLSRRSQRLGDMAANTVVVHTPLIEQPDLDQLLSSNKFNSLSAHPHLEARLRQKVTPAEAAIALQALTRRDLLEPAPRVDLFASLARHFQAKVIFPPDAIEGITDEQYLRNLVEVLYRTPGKPMTQPQPAPSHVTR